jgi:hypothetical protein
MRAEVNDGRKRGQLPPQQHGQYSGPAIPTGSCMMTSFIMHKNGRPGRGKIQLYVPGYAILSWQCVPCAASAAVEREMALSNQLAEVLLQCVSACACQFYNVTDCYSSVLAGVFDDA